MLTQTILQPIVDYAVGGVSPSWPIPYKSDVAPDFTDLTSMFIGRDGSGGNPGPGDVVGRVTNKGTGGGFLTAPADNQRPLLDLTNGVYSPDYDGVDDGLTYTFPGGAGPADCSVFFAVKTSDTQFILASLSSSGGSWFYPAVDGDTSTTLSSNSGLSIGYRVNGLDEAPSTRDDLHSLLATGDFVLLEVTNLNLSGWSDMRLSQYLGWQIDGQLIGPIIVETSKLTNSLRRTIEQDLRRKAGIQ